MLVQCLEKNGFNMEHIKEIEKKPIKFQDFKEKDWKKLWVNLKKK